MSKTKIVIALVAVAAIAAIVVGLASAQVGAVQNQTGNPNVANNGLWGWMQGCYRFFTGQTGASPQQIPLGPGAAVNGSVPIPVPSQGSYVGYARGPCWARW